MGPVSSDFSRMIRQVSWNRSSASAVFRRIARMKPRSSDRNARRSFRRSFGTISLYQTGEPTGGFGTGYPEDFLELLAVRIQVGEEVQDLVAGEGVEQAVGHRRQGGRLRPRDPPARNLDAAVAQEVRGDHDPVAILVDPAADD